MAFDFPSSPTEGQVHNQSPGVSFVYRSGAWTPAPMKTALPKNYVVNPAMQISQQQGNVSGAASNYYAADQFFLALGSPTGAASLQRVQLATPGGATDRLRMVVTTADTSLTESDALWIDTRLEALRMVDLCWGTATAKAAVIRFGWKSPAGTYSVTLWCPDRRVWWHFTVPPGQANTDTVQTIIVAPPTDGNFTTAGGFQLTFHVAVGPYSRGGASGVWSTLTYRGDVSNTNGFATVGNTFELFDVGLYADPYKTGVAPPFVLPDYARELRRCQRYWYKQFALRGGVASGTGANRMGGVHPAPMRAVPAGTVVGTPQLWDSGTSATVSSLGNQCNEYACEFDITTTGGVFTVGGRAAVQYYQTEDHYIAVSARM